MLSFRFAATTGKYNCFPFMTQPLPTNTAHTVEQFTWLLDGQPIMDVSSMHRYAIGQYVDTSGDVISHLNISNVRSDDGGLYRCVATNAMGNAEHAARLNVYGPPFVRAIGPMHAIAGETFRLQCPFSGYPIESISWEKGRQAITSSECSLER